MTSSAKISSFNVGNWQGGAFVTAGAFSYCAAAANYKNGVTVAFVLNNNFQWGIALDDANWSLTTGASYPVTYAVDTRASGTATASAISVNEVLIPLTPSVALFKAFMDGEKLKINAAAGTYTFDLTNTIEMLPDLLQCVEAYVGKAPASANPFASN